MTMLMVVARRAVVQFVPGTCLIVFGGQTRFQPVLEVLPQAIVFCRGWRGFFKSLKLS